MPRHIGSLTVACIVLLGLALAGPGCGPTDGGSKDATPSAECDPYDFDCGDGEQCVDSNRLCDGTEDCDTGADEVGCGECEPGKRACDDGTCILAFLFCDGIIGNCPDRSDEDNCP